MVINQGILAIKILDIQDCIGYCVIESIDCGFNLVSMIYVIEVIQTAFYQLKVKILFF